MLGTACEPNPDRAMSVGAALEQSVSQSVTQTDVEPEYEVRSIQTQTRLHAVAASDAAATSSVVDARAPAERVARFGSYLVDPASSHMLVSKIKPCMSKHKLLHSEAANGSLGHP